MFHALHIIQSLASGRNVNVPSLIVSINGIKHYQMH